jgi:hypothetical protein
MSFALVTTISAGSMTSTKATYSLRSSVRKRDTLVAWFGELVVVKSYQRPSMMTPWDFPLAALKLPPTLANFAGSDDDT